MARGSITRLLALLPLLPKENEFVDCLLLHTTARCQSHIRARFIIRPLFLVFPSCRVPAAVSEPLAACLLENSNGPTPFAVGYAWKAQWSSESGPSSLPKSIEAQKTRQRTKEKHNVTGATATVVSFRGLPCAGAAPIRKVVCIYHPLGVLRQLSVDGLFRNAVGGETKEIRPGPPPAGDMSVCPASLRQGGPLWGFEVRSV
ncbi:hypothetical protein F5X68DRAFT_78684 [Plectosphaerella plurivora]|uniref:Uncharacterized protein n=1 Tax=Plectosphaerella plurivora TaxID=936078 RepID=A0A9P9ABM8_9PEZI|nr:hypothetical protein F5X68DRAFT_78684 [Plectosphaerella plurivora]